MIDVPWAIKAHPCARGMILDAFPKVIRDTSLPYRWTIKKIDACNHQLIACVTAVQIHTLLAIAALCFAVATADRKLLQGRP